MPPNAKTQMNDAGVFKTDDIIVRSHSSTATSRPRRLWDVLHEHRRCEYTSAARLRITCKPGMDAIAPKP